MTSSSYLLRGVPMRSAQVLAFLFSILVLAVMTQAQGWPREIVKGKSKITVYQPQLEGFDNNRLTARAAVSVKRSAGAEPVFGAIWLDARVDTDRDKRTVRVLEAKVTKTRFPESDAGEEKALAVLVEGEIPKWNLDLSLDRLIAGLEAIKKEESTSDEMKTDAPKIVFVDHPAVLVPFDGPPKLQGVDGRPLMRVVNSPFLIVLQTASKTYYLDGGQIWYSASDISGPWQETKNPPQEVRNLRAELKLDEVESAAADDQDPRVPSIVIATEPTELVVTDGKLEFTPIGGTDLLYVSNSDSDVFMEIGSQAHFVVLSGRWYRSKELAGPWTYVASDALPESFAKIPDGSEKSHVSTFVAGTQMAEDALLDTQVPQTSAVKRSATITVDYDGKPEWKRVADSKLEYAVNTQFAVLRLSDSYYCCHEGVWYQAMAATGPWVVATKVPSEIHSLPPSCPIYFVKYVYIYDVMPEVVYVGYTPGYTCCYVYRSTIIYGTGWYYRPWYRGYYCARPVTYGFCVRYNPYYGWRCGFSFSNGRVTIAFGRGAWWGPARYNRYHRGYNHGYRRGYRAGYARGRHNANIYNRPQNRSRNIARTRPAAAARPSQPANRKNNVFADRNGNVHRRTADGWQERRDRQWSNSAPGKTRPVQRPAARPVPTRPAPTRPVQRTPARTTPSSLSRHHNARQRGAQRTNAYRQPAPRGGAGKSGGRRR